MFYYSFSTVLMTVLTSTVLIGIIAICFRSDKVFATIGDKLLAVLILLTLLRFVFPIEIPLARNIYLPKSLSIVISYIRHTFFSIGAINLSIWFLIECVWFGGMIYKLIRTILSYVTFQRFIDRYGLDVTTAAPYAELLSKICDSRKINFRVILVPGLNTPCQSGVFKPCILIPPKLQMTEEEACYILSHEMAHYRHHDFLIKQGMNLLAALYWWNPLCHRLRRQLDILLELKADLTVTHNVQREKLQYYKALTHLGETLFNDQETKPSKQTAYLSAPGAVGSIEDLTRRAQLALQFDKPSLPAFWTMLAVVASLFISSYCFTLEAYHLAESDLLPVPEVHAAEMYAIILEDGTYDIYWGDVLFEHVDSLEYDPNIPVINLKD